MANNTPSNLSESGNVLFLILLAIVLIGAVTAAVRSGGEGGNIDAENIAIKASSVQQFVSEVERGVAIIIRDGASEVDISFAHPDLHADYGSYGDSPSLEVFHPDGGGVDFQSPPSGLNDGSEWEFYGNTHYPQVGTPTRAELTIILPSVTADFCTHINKINEYDTATQPADTGTCLHTGSSLRFTSAQKFTTGGSLNTVNEATFTTKPSMQGCAECSGSFHFFHVLMAR